MEEHQIEKKADRNKDAQITKQDDKFNQIVLLFKWTATEIYMIYLEKPANCLDVMGIY